MIMKHSLLMFTAVLALFAGPLGICSADAESERTVFVFKPDGTKHCERYEGTSVKRMALELREAGVKVYSGQKGYDGREGVATCGDPTGQINIYEIHVSDYPTALDKGFTRLPENWTKQE